MARKKAALQHRRKPSPARPRGKVERRALPRGADAALLSAMSLRVSERGKAPKRLTGAEVEQALLSGEHARTLETYFGEAEYAELRQLAARATRRSLRGGPRVLILPGILGSLLSYVNPGGSEDGIWIDFIDIMLGRLKHLRIPGRGVRAVDVHQATYLKLKLWLQDQGFDADFHPYDWRLAIPELGRQLAERVRRERAGKLSIVAHSMGGLVTRAALGHGLDAKLERLVMLGTPNFGSFAPAMVFRGAYPFVNKIAALDLKHSAEELANEVFSTHPGLTQMLPQRAKFSAVDLYDIGSWPSQGARPSGRLLAEAPKAQQQFAVAAERFVMIAGVDRETTVGLRVEEGQFVFERSRAGDGTVPVELAVLPDVLTYYIAEEHGSLPKNVTVHKAVADILRAGSTSRLADRWEATRGDALTQVSERELRERFAERAKRSAEQLNAVDLRNIMSELVAPATALPAVAEAPAAALVSGGAAEAFQSLVVGRRRQRRIEIRLARGSITQVRCSAYVLGLFQGVAPAGAASAIDALMEGAVTDFRQRRMFASAVGEVFILPGGRNDLRTDYVVFAGLGSFDMFNLKVLETVAENIARTLARTELYDFVTVPIGSGTGMDLEDSLEALLRGLFRGLEDADASQSFRCVTLCEVDEARYDALKWVLYRLSSTSLFDGVEVTLTEVRLPPAPVTRRDAGSGMPPSIYLNVRTQREGGELSIESSLLTTGPKATVMSGVARVREQVLREHLDFIESDGFDHAAVAAFGARLAGMVLDKAIIAGLKGCAGNHVVVVHDGEASRIPWETVCLDGHFPALRGGMSRRYVAGNLSVAKWLEERRHEEVLQVLLVVNPTRDLQGAQEEGDRVQQLFGNRDRVRITRIEGATATCGRLRAEFASGKYDILHYAGHAAFDKGQISRSGIECSDGRLSGAELAEIGKLPSLVFFNACESARVRKRVKRESALVSHSLRERIDRNIGLAEAFLRGGVANYVGTYWPVGDASAKAFADQFYGRLLEGDTLGGSLDRARAAVDRLGSQDWADYILYGSVDFHVKRRGGGAGS